MRIAKLAFYEKNGFILNAELFNKNRKQSA